MKDESSGRTAAFIGEALRIRIYLALAELLDLGLPASEAARVLAEAYRRHEQATQRTVASLGEALGKLSDESLLLDAVKTVFGRVTTPEEEAVFSVGPKHGAAAFRAAARMLLLNDDKTVLSV